MRHCSAQQPLSLSASDLELRGDAQRELNKGVIQIRHPQLERMCHGHFVGANEQLVLQPAFNVVSNERVNRIAKASNLCQQPTFNFFAVTRNLPEQLVVKYLP